MRRTRNLDNVEEIINSRESAITHLYRSINTLDPENDEIDAKIYEKVVNDSSFARRFDNKDRQLGFSAQEVRQDMKILKSIRESRRLNIDLYDSSA